MIFIARSEILRRAYKKPFSIAVKKTLELATGALGEQELEKKGREKGRRDQPTSSNSRSQSEVLHNIRKIARFNLSSSLSLFFLRPERARESFRQSPNSSFLLPLFAFLDLIPHKSRFLLLLLLLLLAELFLSLSTTTPPPQWS